MNYIRVIPRDLFNEASLLKCYGKLYLNLEHYPHAKAELNYLNDGDVSGFGIWQNEATGGLTITNIELVVRGNSYPLERPLNSRRPYPLYVTVDDEAISVFDDDGGFTEEMEAFLSGPDPG